MSLSPGARVGSYEVASLLGVGGMGEVYRARDTKLNRDVALKVIADAFALDQERLARFRREAQVLASLNHPHIGAIYGFEDSGDVHALVLELVEGDTLADRIARGPLPFDEALPIGRQIAEALEAAHEHGIIHRDLKPANIKVTPDGGVKVLDFGLAKLTGPAESGSHARADFSQSPTITSPAMVTGIGTLLGTAAYMSPEQAKGRPADKRSDVWAFGCVLYEMLTARRAFDGEDMTEVLAAVVRAEPDWAALPADVPPAVRTLLHRCLVKDRRARVADVAAALFVLDHQTAPAPGSQAALARPSPGPRWPHIAALTGGALVVAGLAVMLTWLALRPLAPPKVVTTITTSAPTELTRHGSDRDIAITPDGSRIVYRGDNQLLVRTLNHLEPKVLDGVGAARGVFLSPDGQSVGFFAGGTMKRVAITGGAPETVFSIQEEGDPRGASWSVDGTIIFAASSPAIGLQRVAASGGRPVVLTTPNRERGERDHQWPEFLPDGQAVLFTISPSGGGRENAQIAVLDLKTSTVKILFRGGSHARYVATGHLVYGHLGTLRAVPFDLERLEIIGTHEQVLEGVATSRDGATNAAASANGSLIYVPGAIGGAGRRTVVSMDRQGRVSPLPGLPLDSYRDVRVSPDGARLALSSDNGVATYDVARAAVSALTTDSAREYSPLWTPDSDRIVYSSNPGGYPELFWRPADGSASGQRLLTRGKDILDVFANGWTPDRQLLFTEVPGSVRCAIGQVAIGPASEGTLILNNEVCNAHAALSPNGRWIAYRSRRGRGRDEIYVERYPALGGRVPISSSGGTLPAWSRDGTELFFISPDAQQMYSVAVQTGMTLSPGRPQLLFRSAMAGAEGGARPYDVTPDGRFVVIQGDRTEVSGGSASSMILVQNWFDELKRLVPTN